MKKILFLILGLISLNVFPQWQEVDLGTNMTMYSAEYYSNDTIFISKVGGLYKSVDAGANWSEISFVNELNVPIPSTYFRNMYFKTSNVGLGVGLVNGSYDNSVAYTTNSSNNWTISNVQYQGNFANDIHFISYNVGFFCSRDYIHKTVNGGSSWFAVHSSSGAVLRSIDFIDNLNGVCIGSDNGDNFFCTTTDGGATWTQSDIVGGHAIEYATSGIIYVSGGDGIYKSTDGGLNWAIIENSPVALDIQVIDENVIFTTGFTNYRSTDGGEHWEYFPETSGYMFHDIDFSDINHAICVGEQGAVYKIDNAITACAHPIIHLDVPTSSICQNIDINFNNQNSLSYTYQWIINDQLESTEYNPDFTFTDSGTHEIKLVGYNGCYYDTIVKPLYVLEDINNFNISHSVEIENDTTCGSKNLLINIDPINDAQIQVNIFTLTTNDTIHTINDEYSFDRYVNPLTDSIFIITAIGFNECDTVSLFSDTITTPYFGIDWYNLEFLPLKDTVCMSEFPTCMITNPLPGRSYTFSYGSSEATSIANNNDDTLFLELGGRPSPGYYSNYDLSVSYDIGTLHCEHEFNYSYILRFYNEDAELTLYDCIGRTNDTICFEVKNSDNIDSLWWSFPASEYINNDSGFSAKTMYETTGVKDFSIIAKSNIGCESSINYTVNVLDHLPSFTQENCLLNTFDDIVQEQIDKITSHQVDQNGNHFVAGFNTYTGTHGVLFLEKHNMNGTRDWRIRAGLNYPSHINGLQIDDNQNSYFCGNFWGLGISLTGYNSWSTVRYDTPSNGLFISKADSLGNIQWVLGPANGENYSADKASSATDILYVNDDSIFVMLSFPANTIYFTNGTFDLSPSGSSYASFALVQINSDGEYINHWNIGNGNPSKPQYSYSNSNSSNHNVVNYPKLKYRNGKIIVFGEIVGWVNLFGFVSFNTGNNSHIYYSVLNPATGWEAFNVLTDFGIPNQKEGDLYLDFDNQGNMYFCMSVPYPSGYSGQNFHFSDSENISVRVKHSSSLLFKYNSNNELDWHKTLEGLLVKGIKLVNNDSLSVIGDFEIQNPSYSFGIKDENNEYVNTLSTKGGSDIAILNFLSDGTAINVNQIGSIGQDLVESACYTDCGNVSILGTFGDNTSINGDTLLYHNDSLTIFTVPYLGQECFLECLPITILINNLTDANNGVCNGSISIDVIPVANYTYEWYNGNNSDSINNLCAGIYNVTVTGEYNNSAQASYEIENIYDDNYIFEDTLFSSIDTCIFDNSLSIDSAYIYDYEVLDQDSINLFWIVWQNEDSILLDQNIAVASFETYLVYLELICNSDSSNYYGVYDPEQISIYLNSLANASDGVCNGFIDIEGFPSGNHNYIWETGEQTDSIGDLCAGTYNVTVESVNNGNAEASFSIENIYNDSYSFVDTLASSIDTCIFDSTFPIDSAFIYEYNLIGVDSIVLFWEFWQNGDSILLDQYVAIGVLETNLVYFEVICSNMKSLNTVVIYQFYGVCDYEIDTKGHKAFTINTIQIYPNPTSSEFRISVSSKTKNTTHEVSIYNLTGTCLFKDSFTSEINISTKNYSKGIYLVKIEQEEKITIQKLIIRK